MPLKPKTFLALGSIIAGYVLVSFFMGSIIDEDAFIYFRCAENIAAGNGPVFNPGGENIEACSSVTWLLLLALFEWLGLNIIISAKIMGIVLGAVSLVLIYRITRIFINDQPWATVPSLLTALTPPFIMWNQMGLETALYTAVVLLLVLVCMSDKQFFWSWPAVALFLIATRPEGFFLLAGLLPVLYFFRARKQELKFSITIFLCGAIILLAMRIVLFHDFFPSPFYHKVFPGKYKEGLSYIHQCFKDYYIYYLLIPLAALIGKRWNWEEKRFTLFFFMIIYLLWVLIAGSDYKPLYRHMVPLLPVIYIYAITGIVQALGDTNFRKKLMLGGYVIIFIAFILLLSPITWYFEDPEPHFFSNKTKNFIAAPKSYVALCLTRFTDPAKYDYADSLDTQVLLGKFIKQNYFKGTTLLYDQMGRVPYFAGKDFNFIDSNGLTDKTIGRAEFYYKCRTSPLLRFYEIISRQITKTVFPENSTVALTSETLMNYAFKKNPEVIMCFAPMRTLLIDLIPTDRRFKDNYQAKYLIGGVLIFQKKGLNTKPLDIPEGLPVIYAQDIFKDPYLSSHPLVSAVKKYVEY